MEINSENLVNEIMSTFNKTHQEAILIAEDLINTFINRVNLEMSDLSFKEFYKRYLTDNNLITYKDFTTSEIIHIIEETSLSERDKEIARLRYIECKSEEEISYKLMIDKKTVHSNLPKISSALKQTCKKLYKISL